MKAIEKWCDEQWSYIVKLRAGFKCELCGSTNGLQSHHIFYRRFKNIRWLKRNGICLCVVCHEKAHRLKKQFSEAILYRMSKEEWRILEHLKNSYLSRPDMEVVKERLKKELKELKKV